MRKSWWTHSQNLNEKPGGRHGPKLVHGRAWLHGPNHKEIGVEWVFSLKPRYIGAKVERGAPGCEHDFALTLHFVFFSLYLHTSAIMPAWWLVEGYAEREYGLTYSFEGDLLSWDWHAKVWESSSRDPWWMHKGWFLRDVIFGDADYTSRELKKEIVEIPMPEGSYRGTVALSLAGWKRPRWPWVKEILRAEIDVPGGIPVPGKGENAWDCDEDAIYSLTTQASTVPEAIAAIVESALKTRRRYGGKDWQPQAKRVKEHGQ
jgi:hypothetical protein